MPKFAWTCHKLNWTYSTRRSVVSICIGVLMCTLASVRRPRTLISILTFVSCVRGLLSPASLNMRARATLQGVVLLLRRST